MAEGSFGLGGLVLLQANALIIGAETNPAALALAFAPPPKQNKLTLALCPYRLGGSGCCSNF